MLYAIADEGMIRRQREAEGRRRKKRQLYTIDTIEIMGEITAIQVDKEVRDILKKMGRKRCIQ
ncbi:MAG: hypothetical protein J7K61_01935 [Thermoplasmata archaeon]|nr:hypothetical protein [Thermoplasmata archaeon]